MKHRNQPFDARLFDGNQGNDGLAGTVSLDQACLRFESEPVAIEIPLGQVILELEKGGNRVCFYDINQPEAQIFTNDDSILGHASFLHCGELRRQLNAILTRRELASRLRLVLYFVAGCFLAGAVLSWASGAMVRAIAGRVPPEWERKFGDEEMKKLNERMIFLDASNELAQLEMLAQPLLRVVPLRGTQIRFHIAQSSIPNAFALPGGHVIINTGLLDMTETPEELLGVIAHELAHMTRKHHIREVIAASGPVVIFGVFLHSGDAFMNVLAGGAGVMVYKGFSQDYEQEADDFGWQYLLAAHVDPRGMTRCFRKLKAYEGSSRLLKLPQAFSSHPALDKRIARLERKWKKLDAKSTFLELTNRVPRIDPASVQ